jgi:hypothetical protein
MPYVKSPVASLCLACSSVRNLVRVTMSVFTCSVEVGASDGAFVPLADMIAMFEGLNGSLLQRRNNVYGVVSRNSFGEMEDCGQ